MPDQNAGTGELHQAETVVAVPLPAGDDAPEVGGSAARTISFADVAAETLGIMPKKPWEQIRYWALCNPAGCPVDP